MNLRDRVPRRDFPSRIAQYTNNRPPPPRTMLRCANSAFFNARDEVRPWLTLRRELKRTEKNMIERNMRSWRRV